MLCLSRQALPTFREAGGDTNLVALGAYVVVEPEGGRDVTLIATGSEVSIALEAAKLLASDGVRAAVVSAPCFDLFRRQSREYRAERARDAFRGSASKPRSRATGRAGSATAANSSA